MQKSTVKLKVEIEELREDLSAATKLAEANWAKLTISDLSLQSATAEIHSLNGRLSIACANTDEFSRVADLHRERYIKMRRKSRITATILIFLSLTVLAYFLFK